MDGDAVTGISKEQDEADALKKFDDGNIVYSLVKNKPNGKETELVCGNYTGTSLNKETALAWLKFTDENEFHTNDRSFWDMLLGRNRGQYMQKVKHYTQVDHFIYDNGVIYCYAGDTLFRINSFSFTRFQRSRILNRMWNILTGNRTMVADIARKMENS